MAKIAPPPQVVRPSTQYNSSNNEKEGIDSTIEPIVSEKREAKLIDKMQETAKEEPEEIARVIKTMMVE